ncbi:hypothetical protein Rhal01_01719 [Rubritalea halochordaticola]|uniref:Translocation and assembly module TamB C-terminal domain-containing protein n=1 Tax=Rubritalea halochordaticola TaxID=714537 RepID=A0ABP9UYP1_9BACT
MPEKEDITPTKKAKRKWTRRLGWTGAVLLALGYTLNGPGARWAVSYGLDKGLETQGMSGSAEVEGTLASGFVIQNLQYSGEQGLQQLEADKLVLDYRILELLDQKIRGVSLENARVVMDVSKFPPSEEDPEDPHAKLRETLSLVRSWVEQPEITITDLQLSLLQEGAPFADFSLSELSHASGSSDFQLSGFTAKDSTGSSTAEQVVNLTWQEYSAILDRFEILPGIALSSVKADWQQYPTGSGTLSFYDAELDISVGESLSASLTNGQITTQAVQFHLGIPLPAEAVLSQLELEINNWQETPVPSWEVQAKLAADSLQFNEYLAKDLGMDLSQKDQSYTLKLETKLNETELSASAKGSWSDPESKEWWKHTKLDYALETTKLGNIADLWIELPEGIELQQAAMKLSGNLSLSGEVLDQVQAEASVRGIQARDSSIPEITLSAEYQSSGTVTASANSLERFELEAFYDLNSQDYSGAISFSEQSPEWINDLLEIFELKLAAEGPLDFAWSGKGNIDLKKPQIGTLKVNQLELSLPEIPKLSASTNVSYQWPDKLDIHSLSIREEDWLGQAQLNWDGKNISIKQFGIQRDKEPIATITGNIPYHTEITTLKEFLGQKAAWNLNVDTKQLSLAKLRQWFALKTAQEINGSLELDFKLAGSPRAPSINGLLRAINVSGIDDKHIAPLNLSVDFRSEEEQLRLSAELSENQDKRIALSGTFPFTPEAWLEDPNLLETLLDKSPIDAKLTIEKLPLARFKKFIPKIESIEGSITGEANVKGTIHDPKFQADIKAEIPQLKLGLEEFRDARNLKLNAKISDSLLADLELTAQINGGDFKISGKADLNDLKNPSFDIDLMTKYALVHRDDLISARANTNLNLKGTLKEATLSGRIGLVESLLYKDIELLPIGVPSSAVAEVKLPAIDPEKAEDGLPIPEPFGEWKLDLTVLTEDPILARGNIASGFIRGSIKVGGTLKNPEPNGSLSIRNVKAKLPFSLLEIPKGSVIFTPKNGLVPTLDIRGKSSIGNYDVSVFVYGSASSPKTAFTSYPPLPESEVMALIATGSTTSGLEDQEVAAFKALQIFLIKMRQKAEQPGGNQLFVALLKGVENLNLNVGEKDAFTGREYYSATIELTPQWHLTAQVDNEQQTRGLVIYVIRFR